MTRVVHTVDAGNKNTLGVAIQVLITGIYYIVDMKTDFLKMVLYPECSYNRHPL